MSLEGDYDNDNPEWMQTYTRDRKHARAVRIIKITLALVLPVLIVFAILQRSGLLR